MEETLYRYNPWWEGKYILEGVIDRPSVSEPVKKHMSSREIIFLTGLRRVGKTTLLKLFIKHLIEKEKIAPSHIFYVSLDDYLLAKKTILELIEEYRKIQRLSFKEKVFIFLDEVAHKDDFELQLKNLYDSQNVKIYASSSQHATDCVIFRSIVIDVLPLDFPEYMEFKRIHIGKGDRHLLDGYFEDYLKTGGLPEYVLRGDMEYLKELVDDIINKDIAVFYNIRNPQVLKDFFMLLMERAGKIASINKMARILNISPDTAKRYLGMFADTYLIYLVPRYGKTNERILSPKKVYSADLGVRNIFTGFRDKGSLFENYVYLKIKERNPCYIYEDGTEIDFLTDDKILIEVKYQSDMTEKQRELFNRFKAKKKVLIKGIRDLGLIS